MPPSLSSRWVRLLSGRADPASQVRATHCSGKEKGPEITPAEQRPVPDDKTKTKHRREGAGSREQGCQLWRNRQERRGDTPTRKKTSWLADNPGVAARDLLARASAGQRDARGPTPSSGEFHQAPSVHMTCQHAKYTPGTGIHHAHKPTHRTSAQTHICSMFLHSLR